MSTTRTILRLGALAACSLLVVARMSVIEARELRFEQRVAAQEAMEQVYWSHRIWPQANHQPKPPLESVLPDSAIRVKVARELRLSARLDAARRRPLTGAELQGEIDRIAAATKAPETLRELFAALDDDPFLIAECLARPALVARLAAEARLPGDRGTAEAPEAGTRAVAPPPSGYVIPALPNGGCANDGWGPSALTNGTGTRTPSPRHLHTAVWTGSELLVWGGYDGANDQVLDDGGRYNPTIDAWVDSGLTTGAGTNVPSARARHTAVWTGTEMIVWGGYDASGNPLNTGGRYDPVTDSWAVSNLTNGSGTNVPGARFNHTALWTGSAMIVWGGATVLPAGGPLNTGGVYDPGSDTWSSSLLTTGSGAFTPSARTDHTAVWTNSVMIIWGGRNAAGADLADGGSYDPLTNSWVSSSLNTSGGTRVPSARHFHTAVWTGTEMIVWGGAASGAAVNTGGRYNPSTDGWALSSLTNGTGTRVPSARQLHTAIWTGGEMIVWGGSPDGSAVLNNGGRYSPVLDGWVVTSLTDASGVRVPEARKFHTSVWTGPSDQRMIVWGGNPAGTGGLNTGGLYCGTCPIVVWHADADGDGHGDPAVTLAACVQPGGYVASADDCNDANGAVHPGAAELCNAVDDDCDLVVDNGGGAICTDGDACTIDVCNGAGGCSASHPTANIDVTGFSATRVDGRDLVILANAWNACSPGGTYNAAADLDLDGCVDLTDFHLFMNSFGQSCP